MAKTTERSAKEKKRKAKSHAGASLGQQLFHSRELAVSVVSLLPSALVVITVRHSYKSVVRVLLVGSLLVISVRHIKTKAPKNAKPTIAKQMKSYQRSTSVILFFFFFVLLRHGIYRSPKSS